MPCASLPISRPHGAREIRVAQGLRPGSRERTGTAAHSGTPFCRNASMSDSALHRMNDTARGTANRQRRAGSWDCAGSPCPAARALRWLRMPRRPEQSSRHCRDPAVWSRTTISGCAPNICSNTPRGRTHQRNHTLAVLRRGQSLQQPVRKHGHLDPRQVPVPFSQGRLCRFAHQHGGNLAAAAQAPLPAGECPRRCRGHPA